VVQIHSPYNQEIAVRPPPALPVSSVDPRPLHESSPGLCRASKPSRESMFPFADRKALMQNGRAFADRFCGVRLRS
jgi:hypothetical protein